MKRHEDLFFPSLKRRTKYKGKGKGIKEIYKNYYGEIEEDCKSRCVYCDVSLEEYGYEGMVLDHFRPQKHFPSLKDDPHNLVLACPKCNRLKWHHWPCEKENDKPSYSGDIGFIDPFKNDRKVFFTVDTNGMLLVKLPPATYMIVVLKLNRNARVQVRRKRIIDNEFQLLFNQNNKDLEKLKISFNKGDKPGEIEQELNRLLKIYQYLSNLIHSKK